MEHQDWETTVWTKNAKQRRSEELPPPPRPAGSSRFRELDGDNPPPPPKLALDSRIELQKARLAKGMTQKALALQLNVKPSDVTDYESGKTIPPPAVKSKMHKILGVKITKK